MGAKNFMYLSREKLTKMGLLAGITVLCGLIVSVILSGISQFKLSSQLASVNQVSNLSHLLVRQQANLLSLMLVKNAKNEELVEALENFAKENFVVDANIYAPTGVLLAQTTHASELKSRLQETHTQQIVEPIFAQQDLVGFLRVTFDTQYTQTTKSKVDRIFHQLYGELIILVLVGGLSASSYHYFFRRRVKTEHMPIKLTASLSKSQTQRFHSRRRVFKRK